ncbi:MAG: hypothetical protein A2504_06005 [Bdellovibrionales bacterium RIFOXYD12_FULL_39_22]|nr:MAG: hypothetical protein A2385_08325 [Bdellovibrionales bacterium RIFOXYB1_FULL_39_21]OFZ45290.1 MAG: hypothetical protein A2485_06210 [Bdellovibrionales bacterium RIFOXYC12_FULL_39_17]OFZ45520.1 MAG: hypothetical protein A2404_02905 [Bdellovibrionales bacterium RIFOXYC1_FULL_39_130]OFZ77381.1 MAG: hypothetical protein A2560_08495 [Bdellovibrionales bacterium RIFOXYD1_FULL_39_84]OFZ91510.1 MAG: hypothetical protein A2504_06005 [Bdellovibrionales bacterium RIFOXYD12_FULL_39_22]HLE12034.1 FA
MSERAPLLNFDVLIIGCGIAGMSAAIKLAEAQLKIGIITREENPQVTNTFYAQGGIIFSKGEPAALIADIMKASSMTSSRVASEVLAIRSAGILQEVLLDKVQVNFSHDEQNQLKKTKEAAHSIPRIIYKGDYTGKEIQVSMLNYISDKKRFPNITIFSAHTAIDLLTPSHHGINIEQRYEADQVVGAYVLDQHHREIKKIIAKTTILASGGIGALYSHHSNAEGCRGDGHAMAKRAGAILANMEFIQFHPTTFYDQSSHRRFLISEAVRGEGGILRNSNGEEFMAKYHPDKELAPRDVVARAILEEIITTGHSCVYLDISHHEEAWIIERFPTIYKHCLEHEIDITKTAIPVVPAAHYTCGGIKVDLQGRTNLANLYAVGEVSCTGLHGANRLASTALLEGLTWGNIAAEDILEKIGQLGFYSREKIKDWKITEEQESDLALIQQDWMTVKNTMWNYVGLVRTTDRLNRANAMFRELTEEIERFYRNVFPNDTLIGLRNAVEVGSAVIAASIRNKESVGCFYRK